MGVAGEYLNLYQRAWTSMIISLAENTNAYSHLGVPHELIAIIVWHAT